MSAPIICTKYYQHEMNKIDVDGLFAEQKYSICVKKKEKEKTHQKLTIKPKST